MNSTDRHIVVVGFDRSEHARAAVAYAADHAMRRHLRLRIVHAYDLVPYVMAPAVGVDRDPTEIIRTSAQTLLDDTVAGLASSHPDLLVTTRLTSGSAVATLIEESAEAESVVIGFRGVGGFADLVVGSTTLHVVSHSHCPVIAVPFLPDGEATGHGVVVGVDGSELSQAAVEWAFAAADELREPLIAVHTWSDPSQVGPGVMMPLVIDAALVAKEEQIILAEAIAGWSEKYPDVPVESKVVRGHPVKTLVRESRSARLLVVGSRGRGTIRSLLLGSVGHGVLHHATVPVAVVRRGAESL